MKILTYVIFFLYISYKITDATKQPDKNFLLVISLDGFRYDYLDKYSNKNGFLRKIAATGSRACWSESVFPSNTYPNHWSIVTGLFPGNHGVTNNHIYDPESKESYDMYGTEENKEGWFQDSEPIWITNKKASPLKNSVVFDWPGSPAKFQNQTASVFRQIKLFRLEMHTFNKTIDEFVGSIVEDTTNLGIIYFGEPDLSGHMFGPDSFEVREAVQKLDSILENLFKQLKTRKGLVLADSDETKENELRKQEIDLVILTDHGMKNIRAESDGESYDRKLSLGKFSSLSLF